MWAGASVGVPVTREDVVRRLVRWADDQAPGLRARLIGPDQLLALETLTADHDTLVAALRGALDLAQDRETFAIGAALLHLWTVRGMHTKVQAWGNRLLRAQDPAGRARQGRPCR